MNFLQFSGLVKEDFIGYTNIMGDTTGEHIDESTIARLQAINLICQISEHSLMMEQAC